MGKNSNTKEKVNIVQVLIIAIIVLGAIIGYLKSIDESEVTNDISNNTVNSISNASTQAKVDINSIPKYSGQTVIDINNNEPYFEEKDMTKEDFEYYSELDELGRAGQAFANICKLTMPPEGVKRESLSYKPSGWNQYLYGENNSKHLYERCHLIAWQLGNENNNKKNLITGTSQMNSSMIEYENLVANWVKQKSKEGKDYHVLYRVTPIYKGDNKLATGVEVEAKSVEEEGVSFNKFMYNVQDNFEIDYSTGKAKEIK